MLEKILRLIGSKDAYTWVGHYFAADLIALTLGWPFALGAFGYRELSNFWDAFVKAYLDIPPMAFWTRVGDAFQLALKRKGVDGFFDYWFPCLACALAVQIGWWSMLLVPVGIVVLVILTRVGKV